MAGMGGKLTFGQSNTETGYVDMLSCRLTQCVRLIVAGGLTASIVFLLCWVGAFLPYSNPTHAYIGLFTNAAYSSEQALAEGFCWSLLFGGVVGGVFALIYKLTGRLVIR